MNIDITQVQSSSSSRMHVINHNWSATKQRLHPQSVAEISRHSVLSGDRIRHCLGLATRTQLPAALVNHYLGFKKLLHWQWKTAGRRRSLFWYLVQSLPL